MARWRQLKKNGYYHGSEWHRMRQRGFNKDNGYHLRNYQRIDAEHRHKTPRQWDSFWKNRAKEWHKECEAFREQQEKYLAIYHKRRLEGIAANKKRREEEKKHSAKLWAQWPQRRIDAEKSLREAWKAGVTTALMTKKHVYVLKRGGLSPFEYTEPKKFKAVLRSEWASRRQGWSFHRGIGPNVVKQYIERLEMKKLLTRVIENTHNIWDDVTLVADLKHVITELEKYV